VEQAIESRDLRVVRGGRTVLPGLTIQVRRGTVTGLLGPSGSGKTTLLRAIVGVQANVEGSLRVFGQPAGAKGLRSRIGYITQAPSVYADLSIGENLRYFGRVAGVPRARDAEVLATVGLAGRETQVVASLSGGERARVSLATALVGSPELLVLDEPTVGLDPVLRRDLWDAFHALAEQGTTLLVSSHVMDEADRCDELLLLREGRLLAAGTPFALRERTGAESMDQAFLRLIEEEA